MESQNIYATPNSQPDTSETPDIKIPRFSPWRRIGRLRFLAYNTVGYIVVVLFVIIFSVVTLTTYTSSSTGSTLSAAALLLTVLAWFISVLLFSIQRLHDMDISGWLVLLFFIPLINALFWLFLVVWPGNEDDNSYGRPPPPNHLVIWILGFLFPLLTFGSSAYFSFSPYMSIN